MSQISLYLFGPPRVEYAGRPISMRLQKELALLIYLAETSRAHTRMALATLFWPEMDQSAAFAALRRTLYQLKSDIGENLLYVTPRTVSLRQDVAVWRDTQRFLNVARQCTDHEHPPDAPLASCLTAMREAITLYTDDFLAGFSLPDCPMFDEWQFFAREELRAEYLRILALLTASYERLGDWERGAEMARLWLSREPDHEPAHRALIRLYAMGGHYAAARRQYELCRRMLAEHLGAEPDEETENLYRTIESPSFRTTTRPQTRYVRSGDAYLAYQTIGEGPIDLLHFGGFISHIEQLWEEPELARFYQHLGKFARIIVYDKRGMGLSDRVGAPVTPAQHVTDAQAVMEAAGATRVVVFAVSDGATLGITTAVLRPEQVAGLVLYGGQAKGVRSVEYPWGLTPEQYQRWAEKLVKGWGGPVNLEYFSPTRAHDERFRQWWAQIQRLAASPGAVKAILEGIRDADVRSELARIQVPTLVLHRRGDRSVPVEAGRYLASHIPKARYVELPGDDHWWWVGDAQALLDEVGHFIRQLDTRTG
ncbi:MAG TPA: alpha/beta fold hydrolase [Ktedonobacterales bacterium]|nr:alpha/beta fold hydrolase [Ktedonobacterales bacterium]